MEYSNSQGEVFKDFTKGGKDRKWRERKLKNIKLGERLKTLGYKTFTNVYTCSEVLRFKQYEDKSLKLYQTFFCKNKLCPICNWRRSMKYSYQAQMIVSEAMRREPRGRFLFLTLTVKNVEAERLNDTLTDLGRSFNRLMKYKAIDTNVIGYLRATEVTYSADREDYHPHIHVLLMVKPGYFKGGQYITQEEWTRLWAKACKLDYIPVVDIRAVKPNKRRRRKGDDGSNATEKAVVDAILETAKYPVKPFDVTDDKGGKKLSEEDEIRITGDMMEGLYRKRQIGFGKLFKQIKAEFELDDLEEGDLVNTGEETDSGENATDIIAVWNWELSNYYVH